MNKKILTGFLIAFAIPTALFASTTVEDTLTDLHWTLDGSPYVLVDDVVVRSGDALVIDPGVVVEGSYAVVLRCLGSIQAEGTAEDSILFTASIKTSLWDGLMMLGEGKESVFSYCTFEYAGNFAHMHGGAFNLGLWSSNQFDHCTFQNNYSDFNASAAYVNKSYSTFTECVFRWNDSEGTSVVSGDVGGSLTVSKCLFYENSADAGPVFSLYPGMEYDLDHLTIANNTARLPDYSNTFYVNTPSVSITNSIITTTQDGYMTYDMTGGSQPFLDYCLVYAPNITWMNCSSDHLIEEDPLFIDPGNGDFRLYTDSPAIDAGDPSFPLDSDGTVTDLGACGVGSASFYGPDISIPEIAVLSGDTLYLPVLFNGTLEGGIISVQGWISLPEIVSEISDVYLVPGSEPDAQEWMFEWLSEEKQVRFAMAGATAFDGPTPLFEMEIAINSDVEPGDYAVIWDSCLVNESPELTDVGDGAIIVVDDILGDVSLNGSVSAYDGALLMQHLTLETNLSRPATVLAEVSGNGELGAQDVALILQRVVGKIDAFPIETGQTIAEAGVLMPSDLVDSGDGYVYLNVEMQGVENLSSATLSLEYDRSHLELMEVQAGMDDCITGAKEPISGQSIAYLASSNEYSATSAKLMTLVFREVAPRTEDVHITISRLVINDYTVLEPSIDYVLSVVGQEESSGLPDGYTLVRAFPNPFNAFTTIRLHLLQDNYANVTVYNNLGQRIAVICDQRLGAGEHNFTFDAGHLASGIYMIRSEIGKQTDTRRITLLR